jgi:hypothetical protein
MPCYVYKNLFNIRNFSVALIISTKMLLRMNLKDRKKIDVLKVFRISGAG